ncbi:MAG: hypothetical protein KF878_09880 [Planctomycetes bacterium]|nr:hypothetical protein [Planctomycetota bacterium]
MRIFLLSVDGTLCGARWARSAEEALAGRPRSEADPGLQPAPEGAQASATDWTHVPGLLCRDDIRAGATIGAEMAEVGGLRWRLSDGGEPDVEIVDQDALLDLAEKVGPIDLTERLTLRRVRVDPEADHSDPAVDVLARDEQGKAVRLQPSR